MKRITYLWLAVAAFGFAVLPWFQQEDGFFRFLWLNSRFLSTPETAPGLFQAISFGQAGLWPIVGLLVLAGLLPLIPLTRRLQGLGLILVGLLGMAWMTWIGWGPYAARMGLGYGALIVGFTFLFFLTTGAARVGACRGDAFVTGLLGLVIVLVTLFVFFPVGVVLLDIFRADNGTLVASEAINRLFDSRTWRLNCVTGGGTCGVAWNTLFLAIITAASSTLLGLVFALLVTRTQSRWIHSLRAMSVLPIITPPFVLGLALILLFGRNGAVTLWVSDLFGVAPGRWLYGLTGIWMSQVLAFAPIAFMTLIAVAQGISPAMEEASQTLNADRWKTFTRVTLPLMRPGLANAFLLCFIESMADFGNPMVLGGNYNVLSTEIYMAVVGAVSDPGRASGLAVVLITFVIGAFLLQRLWLGRRSYTTVTGKADNGQHVALTPRFKAFLWTIAAIWLTFTITVYGVVLFAGFVTSLGIDNTLTLDHYRAAFGIDMSGDTWRWTGQAWPSFFTTVQIAAISAPLTAMLGVMTAWLLVRQRFAFKSWFEFGTLLSFAVPGTVIGVSYIMAFNVAPIELTGTGTILVLCYVFRTMPMGVRSGIAAMRQLDGSLDEASAMLRAKSFTTVRRVVLPLLKPAIASALVYSFVRSITSISAVIFLVGAQYQMATAYIIGLTSNGHYGIAIAYSSVLLVVMLACIIVVQVLLGTRKLRRTNRVQQKAATPPKSIDNKAIA